MKTQLVLAISLLLLACNSKTKSQPMDHTRVETTGGPVSGKYDTESGIRIFKGIPYAAPPTDSLRWKPPQPVEPWEEVRPCLTDPPSALQPDPLPLLCWTKEFMAPRAPLSEDCLYLNVWTPADKREDKLPVMVWIHGGGLTSGSGTVPLYDGKEISGKGIVFITINYRLGIFGFLAHKALSDESELKTSGNYGILDQIAALKWVQDNIDSFGGDPENVTIAGQSAGAFSVNALMVSPMAKGLFHRAIAHSGGLFREQSPYTQTLEEAERTGAKVFEELGIETPGQLRTIQADSLLKLQQRFGIAFDEVVVPPISATFTSGSHNDVPLLTGWNSDDGVRFDAPLKATDYRSQILERYGDQAEDYLSHFTAGNDSEAASAQKLESELFFGWNNYRWAEMQTQFGKYPAYLYYFTRTPPGEPDYGAFHSAEFAYALHTLHLWDKPFIDEDRLLEETMSSYWVNFARTGDPNGEDLPDWPVYDTTAPRVKELGTTVTTSEIPHLGTLRYLDRLYQ